MFGYIGPEKSELKVRELAIYQAAYCGLCRAIGRRFGQVARLSLSYDCTFIALLLGGLADCPGCDEKFCPYKPLKKKQPVARPSPAQDFAARLNLLLSYYKLRDDWADERKTGAAAAALALRAACRKAEEEDPALSRAVREGIAAISALEAEKCAELDPPADAFAHMMRACVLCAPAEPREKRILGTVGYHMGRWVYLMDAWDDREKDRKSGAYNPFLLCGADAERAGFLLHYSLNEAIKAYDLLELRSNKGVLDNILYEGCVNRTQALLTGGGRHEQ